MMDQDGTDVAIFTDAPDLQQQQQQPTMTGRPPKCVYLSCDPASFNAYQCLIRQNLEFFEATPDDLSFKVRGRNKPIVLGQVGIRCTHCKPQWGQLLQPQQHRQPKSPPKGSVYYPQNLLGIYQAAQTLATGHWLTTEGDHCPAIPPFVRQQMQQLKECSTVEKQYSEGKDSWAERAAVFDVVEHPEWGLRFLPMKPF